MCESSHDYLKINQFWKIVSWNENSIRVYTTNNFKSLILLLAQNVPYKYLFLILFHIKTLRSTVCAFPINSIKISFLVLKSRKTISELARFVLKRKMTSYLNGKMGKFKIAKEFALLRKNHGMRCGRPHKKTVRWINLEPLL
jgi:hypothetical protein